MRRCVQANREHWALTMAILLGETTVISCKLIEGQRYTKIFMLAGQYFEREMTWPAPQIAWGALPLVERAAG